MYRADPVCRQESDNRRGSSADGDIGGGGISSFGLGWVNGDTKIGWYTLRINHAQADGIARPEIESVDGQRWFDVSGNTQTWQPNWLRSMRDGSAGGLSPLPMQVMSSEVLLQASIRNKILLPGNQEFPIDGSATLDVVYL